MCNVLTFKSGGMLCALPLESIREITPMVELYCPPACPPVVEGFVNVAGMLFAVIHLNRLFNLQSTNIDLYTPIILLKDHKPACALLVDDVLNIIQISNEEIRPLADEDTFGACVKGGFSQADRPVYLLNPDRIMTETEKKRLAEMEDLALQRLSEFGEQIDANGSDH